MAYRDGTWAFSAATGEKLISCVAGYAEILVAGYAEILKEITLICKKIRLPETTLIIHWLNGFKTAIHCVQIDWLG
ncbi:MAG: hypothetical protein P8M80_02155 [Pirellulaceae bacterium]|nr:hypothetical protein [Pirellulaceae bacterium]